MSLYPRVSSIAYVILGLTFVGCSRPERAIDVPLVHTTRDATSSRHETDDRLTDAATPSDAMTQRVGCTTVQRAGRWAYFKLIGRVNGREIAVVPTDAGGPRFVRVESSGAIRVDATAAGDCFAASLPSAGRLDVAVDIVGWERVRTANEGAIDWSAHQTPLNAREFRCDATLASLINTTPGTPFFGQVKRFDTLSATERAMLATHLRSVLRTRPTPVQRVELLTQLQERGDISAQQGTELTLNVRATRVSWQELQGVVSNEQSWSRLLRPPTGRPIAPTPTLQQLIENRPEGPPIRRGR